MSHAREPGTAAAPPCKRCGSTRFNKLRAELALHFNGLKNVDKPVLWTFPAVVVCTDCGTADLHVPPYELQWWEQDAQCRKTPVTFNDPIIAQTCHACASTELRTYSSELAVHAPGRGNLGKPALFLFPQVLVCRDCGAARFTVPAPELHPWLNEVDALKRFSLEQDLLNRLERFCESAGLELTEEAWPKDDWKAYFLLGVRATEDMKDLAFYERLERLDSWPRRRNLLMPNETLFAKRR